MRAAPLLLALVALAGCNTIRQSTRMFPNRSADWRQVATKNDEGRLRDWRGDFVSALAAARSAGHGAEIGREGALLQPDAALAGSPIASGHYRCRLIRVGARTPGDRDFSASGPLACRVNPDGTLQRFILLSGLQRPMGLIFPSDGIRQVFLGTLMLPEERRAMQYGADDNRDVAGYLERIGPQRWRLVLPAPRFDSLLDVIELTPVR